MGYVLLFFLSSPALIDPEDAQICGLFGSVLDDLMLLVSVKEIEKGYH